MEAVTRLLRYPPSFLAKALSSLACYFFRIVNRPLDDLRKLVQDLTQRGIKIEFLKEGLVFSGEDSPMAKLMLSVMGAFAEFERALIKERQREGIELAKKRGAYRGRKQSLSAEQVAELRQRATEGEVKTKLAKAFGISRETLFQYLRKG